MRILYFIFFYLFSISLFSQDCFVKKKRSEKMMRKIDQNLSHYSFNDVKKVLSEIQSKEGGSAQLYDVYALIYWLKDDFVKAEEYAAKTIELCPESFSTSNYIIGMLSFFMKEYDKCIVSLQKSLELGIKQRFSEKAQSSLEKAIVLSSILKDTVPYDPELVDGISTEFDEYLPLISPDQEIAFYTRRGERDDFGVVNKKSEEFIISEGTLDSFDSGSKMAYPFNQNNNEGGSTITIDNNVLYFTICSKFSSAYTNCDIYYVERQLNGEWSDLFSLETVNNPKSWESQPSISADGKTLMFASDRKGGYGGVDLYFVKKDKFGNWGDPQNMGNVINSKLDDKSPFLHVDGETLYFSSEQFPSLGGFDIFISRLDADSNWSEPQNIGYPINSTDDEIGMFVTTDGLTAYFCSNKLEGGVGGWDLYSFDLYKEARPERVLFLKGDITDVDGNFVDSVSLNFKNISTNEVVSIFVNDGKYVSALTLEDSDDVLITFDKEGYSFNSHYISSSNSDFSSPSRIDINLSKIKKGATFEIKNIYFATDSFNLNNVSKVILASFADYLIKNQDLELLISGHTDNIGNDLHNLTLSNNRARSVYNFLIDLGVNSSRLSYKGYGESRPVYDDATAEGRSKNRRTECTIINK